MIGHWYSGRGDRRGSRKAKSVSTRMYEEVDAKSRSRDETAYLRSVPGGVYDA
jgi:hypothetical protein